METKKCKKCNQNKIIEFPYDNISENVEKKIIEITAKNDLETNGNKKVYFGNINVFEEKNVVTDYDVKLTNQNDVFDKKSVNNLRKNKTKNNMYLCEFCSYETSYKHHYDKHLSSKKHLKNTGQPSKNTVYYSCKQCNKKYKTRSGLWKHESKCLEQEIIENQVSNVERKVEKKEKEIGNNELLKVFMDFVKTNQEVQQEMINKIIPKIGNNNNNNNISINVFLNEQCKDAINFSDFVNSIQVGVEDVLKTSEIGYSSGISHILMKNLMNLGAFKRPIHCTDNKRLQFIVKDENKWEKDTGEKIKKAITSVSHKQMQEIKKLEKENKIKEEEKYLNLISSAIGPIEDEHKKKNMKEIAKNMGKYLNIKEAMEEKC